MSIDATRWAWQQQDITSTQKLVLLSLADRASENCRCWPSITRLCQDTCLNKKTIITCIAELSKKGLICKIAETGKHNVYELVGVELREVPATAKKIGSTENGTGTKIGPGQKLTSTENGTGTQNGTGIKNGTGTGTEIGPGQKLTSTKNGTTPVPKTVPHQYQNWYSNLKLTSNEPEDINTPAAPSPSPVPPPTGEAGENRPENFSVTKKRYGKFGHVRLTEEDYDKLKAGYPDLLDEAIEYLDIYIGAKAEQNETLARENHFFTLQLWVLDVIRKKRTESSEDQKREQEVPQNFPSPRGGVRQEAEPRTLAEQVWEKRYRELYRELEAERSSSRRTGPGEENEYRKFLIEQGILPELPQKSDRHAVESRGSDSCSPAY